MLHLLCPCVLLDVINTYKLDSSCSEFELTNWLVANDRFLFWLIVQKLGNFIPFNHTLINLTVQTSSPKVTAIIMMVVFPRFGTIGPVWKYSSKPFNSSDKSPWLDIIFLRHLSCETHWQQNPLSSWEWDCYENYCCFSMTHIQHYWN